MNTYAIVNRPFPHSCKQRHQFEARVDSDLYEIVYPRSLDLISLSLLTGAERGKGVLVISSMHIGLDQCCVELHHGTVLRTLSLLLLAKAQPRNR